EHIKLWSTVEREGSWQGELRIIRPSGEVFPARLSLRLVKAGPRDGAQIIGILSDFTELRRTQEELRKLAHFDTLTELPNRLLLLDRMAQASSRANRNKARLALLFMDLDHFKRINDTHGHSVGDLVLCEVATRMLACIRNGDTAARLGGDEFVVLLENIENSAPVISVAEKLRAAMAQPIWAGGQLFHISSSIGIAMFPEDGANAELLLQRADTAMYEAKTAGRNRYAFYNPDMAIKVARYLARDLRLRSALKLGELRLHYQPQVDASTGCCHAVEALLRWDHPERGMLGATEVIPAAEESGLIVDIGRWALREACDQVKRWEKIGCPPFRVAVNVSAKHVNSGTLFADIDTALRETQMNPALLEIEITESAIQTESIAVATLSQIRALGVSVAIDDFGTGYSCLSSLKHLPLDRIKIDCSFVRDLPKDPDSAALTETIIGIANRMNLHVTAEGVETQLHKEFLHSRGCHELQGWFFSPAIAASDIPAFVMGRHIPVERAPPSHIQ
ncbi:MAG: EAL domain-containing protein, partial [Pseudomonadota bacterium]|nr:EAL domain-containing protein [Pseudomonadota bacterium]